MSLYWDSCCPNLNAKSSYKAENISKEMFGHMSLYSVNMSQSADEYLIYIFLEGRTCIFYWYFKISTDTEAIKQNCRLLWQKFEFFWEKSFVPTNNEQWNKVPI